MLKKIKWEIKMTIKQIEYFLKVCESVQINKCAKQLGISQSALSIAIKNLESSLGGTLFDRRAKSLILNERGRSFKNSIVPLYQKILEIEKNMKNLNMYNIKMHCSQNIGNYLLPGILDSLMDIEKKHQLDVKVGNTSEIIASVLSNQCDIGIVEGRIYNDEVKKIKICNDELVIICGDEKFKNKSYYIDEISDYPWVNREIGSGAREILYENIPSEVILNSVLELNSTEAIKKFIENKRYFACIPKFTLYKEMNKGIYEVKLKNITFKRDLTIIYKKDKDENETFVKIVENLKENLMKIHQKYSEI